MLNAEESWDNLIIIQHLSISIAASLKSDRRDLKKLWFKQDEVF